MLVYLDQNYASRIAKHLLGQGSHAPFGELHRALLAARDGPSGRRPRVPPSPFHVLETRGGYLLPTLQTLFEELSDGRWVRPWQEVVARQARRGRLDRRDLLTARGDWGLAATTEPLQDLFDQPLQGGFFQRCQRLRELVGERLGLEAEAVRSLPFGQLLVRLVAFRSLDRERDARPSDLVDLLMAATVGPYVDVLATDRYLRETLQRVGYRRPVFSGRRPEVLRFARALDEGSLRRVQDPGATPSSNVSP